MLCKINKALLPLKVYFFYYLGGLACIVPFMPVFAGQLGFTPGELGVIYGILPFVGLLSKPVVGIIADKLNAHRLVLLVALVVQGVFTFIVYFLPPMPSVVPVELSTRLSCNENSALLHLSTNATSVFCNNSNSTKVNCSFFETSYAETALNLSHLSSPVDFTLEIIGNYTSNGSAPEIPVIIKYQAVSRSTCLGPRSLLMNCTAFLCSDDAKIDKEWVRFTHQFWLFLIVMTIGRVGYTAVYTMGDSVAFDVISQQKTAVSYGTQRVFGSIGWAFAAVIVGLLMDTFSEQQRPAQTDFAPAFYGFIVLMACAVFTAWFLKPSVNIQSTQLLKNVLKLFDSGEFIAFSIGTFFVGMLTGILYTYLFLYMANELNAPKLLMGLSQLGECFGEAPFMFLSSWLIGRLGHHGAMVMALASFSIRYIGYSLLSTTQPWWILVLELFHGPGFGLFYANMATFANNVAPPGAVATMQGVLGGIYDGFGVALGGLIGGSIYERYGGRIAWRSFGIGAGIAAGLYSLVALLFHRRKRQLLKNGTDLSVDDSVKNNGGGISGYETPIPPDTPSEKERLTK